MDESWNIIRSILKDPLSHVQTDSYRGCIQNMIPRVMRQFNPITLQYRAPTEDGEETDVNVQIYVGSVVRDGQIVDNGEGIFFATPTVFRGDKVSPLFPNEARLRDFTYETEITANVHIRIKDESGTYNTMIRFDETTRRVPIGRLPIMVRSLLCTLNTITDDPKITGECTQDQGGYYVIDGNEKVVIGQERQVENRPYTRTYRDTETMVVSCECRSVPEQKFQPPRTTSVRLYRKHMDIRVIAPGMQEAIPFVLLMRTLGIATESRMFDMVAIHVNPSLHKELLDFIRPSFLQSRSYAHYTLESVILAVWSLIHGTPTEQEQSLSRARANDTAKVLKENILPHLGYDMTPKAHFIGSMIADIFLVHMKLESITDKDSYANKRIDMGGFLLGKLFRDLYFRVQKKIQEKMNIHVNTSEQPKEAISIIFDAFIQKEMVDRTIMDEGFRYAFKNCWGMKHAPCVVGIAQELSRYSYPSYLSHIRRINTPLPATAKMRAPHALHASTWGFTCPIETPDGRNVGVRKNFAVASRITVGLATPPIEALCSKIGLITLGRAIQSLHSSESLGCPVCLNERTIGYVWKASEFVQTFRNLRRSGIIHPYVSITYKNNFTKKSIIISTDDGRPIRPLVVVQEGNPIAEYPKQQETISYLCTGRRDITDSEFFSIERIIDEAKFKQWKEDNVLTKGLIEYVDPQEQDNCLIAMSKEDLIMKDDVQRSFTHQEIHASLIMGVLGLNIPFTQTNQAPRNVYSSAQGKQAVGMYATNFNNRMDNKTMVLAYPQKPIVTTHYAPYIRNEIMPHGINAIVAIMSYSGYNQEDAVIINQGAVQRGLFNSVTFRSLGTSEDVRDQEVIGMVPETDILSPKKARRDVLDSRGIVKVGSIIDEDDVLVMKTAPSNFRDPKRRQLLRSDLSLQTKRHESGIVDAVYVDDDRQDGRLVKIRLRKPKTPELGDKFSSRHGQKGTIGMLLPEADMPVNADGIRPDIIVNPHAIPSRMTIGQLVEVILGKRGAIRGEQYAATAFENGDARVMCDLLQTMGMESYSNEVLYNGRTGEQLRVNIFMGPTFYQRLMHQVADKVNVRTTGPRSALTMQPVGGRGSGGGLRIGEMERDALISHGVASFLKESLMERSDKSHIWVGTKSGMISACNPVANLYHDFITEDFSRVRSRNEVGELQRGDDRIVLSNPRSEFCRLEVPHALKLFIQELEAQGYKIGVITDFVLRMWESISPETKVAYEEIVRKSAASSGASIQRSLQDTSWVKPVVSWALALFAKRCVIGLGSAFVSAFPNIQKATSDLNGTIEMRRLGVGSGGSEPLHVVVSSASFISELEHATISPFALLLVSDTPSQTQKEQLQRFGWVSVQKHSISKQVHTWNLWEKRYRNPLKEQRLLLQKTGLFATKMEPLYPTIFTSNPVAGSLYDTCVRCESMGIKTLPLTDISEYERLTRGYIVGPTHAPIAFSQEHSKKYAQEFESKDANTLIIQTKRKFKGAFPLFQTYTKSGYIESVDEERNLYRWIFPMSRLEENEQNIIGNIHSLIDESVVILPDRTLSPGGRILGTRGVNVIPSYTDMKESYPVRAPADEDEEPTEPLVFIGGYPAHVGQDDIRISGISWFWTKESDIATFIQTPEFDVVLPDYSLGSYINPTSSYVVAQRFHCMLVCEPEELYKSLHGEKVVVYSSPYDTWVDASYLVWNPEDDSMKQEGDSQPIYIRIPEVLTEVQWTSFKKWIMDHTGDLKHIREASHTWIQAVPKVDRIRSAIQSTVARLPQVNGLEVQSILSEHGQTIEETVSVKESEAVGSVLGSRGVIASRSQSITGISLTVSGDTMNIKGKVSKQFKESDIRAIVQGYLSYTTETLDIAPILTMSPEAISQTGYREINMELVKKELRHSIIPVKLGNGLNRTLNMRTKQLILRGQRRSIDTYMSTMGIVSEEALPLLDESSIYSEAGKKNFVVVIPGYSMDVMEPVGDITMSEMAQQLASQVQAHLTAIQQRMSYTCEFQIIILQNNMYEPSEYPIVGSEQTIRLNDEDYIMKWNESIMENILISQPYGMWKFNILQHPEYMIWLPCYWTPKEDHWATVMQRFFVPPSPDQGRTYIWKETSPYRVSVWMAPFQPVEKPNNVLEDEDEWTSVLDGVWKEKDWQNHDETLYKKKPSDAMIHTDGDVMCGYISSMQPIGDRIRVIEVVVRPELLESDVWKLKDGDERVNKWTSVIAEHTILTEEAIQVRQKGDDIRIHLETPMRYSLGIIAILLQSVRNAGGPSWQLAQVIGEDILLQRGDNRVAYTGDVMFTCINGLQVPRFAIHETLEVVRPMIREIHEDIENRSLVLNMTDTSQVIVKVNDMYALVSSENNEWLDELIIKKGSVIVYATLIELLNRPSIGSPTGTPPVSPREDGGFAPRSPTGTPPVSPREDGGFAPRSPTGTPPVSPWEDGGFAPRSPTGTPPVSPREDGGFAPRSPVSAPQEAPGVLSEQTLRDTAVVPTLAQRLALEDLDEL